MEKLSLTKRIHHTKARSIQNADSLMQLGIRAEIVDYIADLFDYITENYDKERNLDKLIFEYAQNRLGTNADVVSNRGSNTKVGSSRRMAVIEANESDTNSDLEAKVDYPKSADERQRIEGLLGKFYGSKDLNINQMEMVVDALVPVEVAAGEIVITQGDIGNDFFLIDSGDFEVFRDDKLLHEFKGNGFFGERALICNVPQFWTVKCSARGKLWRLDRKNFREGLMSLAKKRDWMYNRALASNPIFDGIDVETKIILIDSTVQKVYEDGQCIFRQDEVGDCMYFVEEGLIRIEIDTNGNDAKKVTEHRNGECFGELASIDKKPRDASAYSVGRTKLGVLTVDKFMEHMSGLEDILERNKRRYIDNLRQI